MNANFALRPGTILDSREKPMRAAFSYAGWGDYEAARNTRERTLHGWRSETPRPESEMLPMRDRLSIISYLRRSVRNNPVMAALAFRYALTIGSPTIHFNGPDTALNDKKERELERRLRSIVYGKRWDFRKMNKVISVELLLCNEVFIVDVQDKVQLIPSELCGSPTANCPPNEVDGIGYDEDTGVPIYYRFGKRIPVVGNNLGFTRLTFEEKEGATLVDAAFVSHLGAPSRIEESRPAPRLSSVIDSVQNLDDIVKAKVTTVKNQAALSLFFTKNFDPAMWAENSALTAACEANQAQGQNVLSQALARSTYQEVRNGQIMYGEVGEDVKLIEPNLQAQDFNQFQIALLHRICAPVGMPVEEVLIGYSQSNYSSARADRLKMADMVSDERKEREVFFDGLIERQTGIAVDSGDLEAAADGIPDVSYGWPIIREIDEAKHVQAQVAAKAAGIKSQTMLCAENGTFSDQVNIQIVSVADQMARTVKAFANTQGRVPTESDIRAQTVTEAEILAYMPNAESASEAIKAIAASEAAEVNADANAQRAASV